MKISMSIVLAMLMSVASNFCLSAIGNEEGAKGLFFVQLDRPQQSINTGIQYWIELHRGKQVLHVNNRTSFKSGDRIRFHVKTNITGFAYILLKSGSGGEQSVLFPDPSRGDDNHVNAGQDYALPSDGYLAFDANPGIEKVSLLISRTPIDASAYLTTPETERTLIACAATGSKDLIPAKIVLAFSPPAASVPQPIVEKNLQVAPASPKKLSAHKTKTHVARHAKVRSHARSGSPVASARAMHGIAAPAHPDEGVVTVVKKDPGGMLTVDIALEHN